MASPYTDKQKQEALALYAEYGPAKAADRTGIRSDTIRKWAQRAGVTAARAKRTDAAIAQSRAEAEKLRSELELRLMKRVHDLMDRIDQPHQEFVGQQGKEVTYDRAPAAAVKAYVWSIGVLIDKYRLEVGEATERTEVVSQSQFDREVQELVGKVREAA